MAESAEIGRIIRQRRKAAKLTLQDLAHSSGVSVPMLSEVERGRKNPTVKVAYEIARGLGCSLSDLLEASAPPPVSLVCRDARRHMSDENGIDRYSLSHELLRAGFEVAWYELPPGTTTGAMSANSAGVMEHLTVLDGELTVKLGEQIHKLRAKDTLSYGAQTGMEYLNTTRQRCEFLLMVHNH